LRTPHWRKSTRSAGSPPHWNFWADDEALLDMEFSCTLLVKYSRKEHILSFTGEEVVVEEHKFKRGTP